MIYSIKFVVIVVILVNTENMQILPYAPIPSRFSVFCGTNILICGTTKLS